MSAAFETGRAISRRYWVDRLSHAETPRASLRPDAPAGRPTLTATVDALVPDDVRLFVKRTAGEAAFRQYAVMSAGLCLLLRRLGGQSLVAFASPTRRKDHFSPNTFVHLIEVDSRQTFGDLLETCRARLLDDYKHGAYPFPALRAELGLDEDHDLFDLVLADTRVHLVPVPAGQQATWTLDRWKLNCRFLADRYEPSTWQRWIALYWEALRAIAARPQASLSELDVLGARDRHRIVQEWNHTARGFPAICVDELISHRAEQTPHAIAVIEARGGRSLSYEQCEQRAVALARALRGRGLGPGTRVGVLATRSADLLVALIAVWKVRAAFVPLDADSPMERLRRIAEDARLDLVLASQGVRHDVPQCSAPVLRIEEALESAVPGALAPGTKHADQLAYIIYTSGSTGRPKGVMISHRSLANYLVWAAEAYGVKPGSIVPLVSSFAYDLSITSLFVPLLVGASVLIAPNGDDMDSLAHLIESQTSLALLKLTPTHLQALRNLSLSERVAAITESLVVGGEALFDTALTGWRTLSGPKIFNEYGPTETTVAASVFSGDAVGSNGAIPIGRPIANTCIYLIDDDMQPAPDLIAGDIYVGGAGVAQGYADQPRLTAEAFLPDPFSSVPGARLYRTGDRARRSIDGELEYLGRGDRQVKVHGLRMELGEIEAIVAQRPDVRAAAVVLERDAQGGDTLIAYLVPDGQPPSLAEMRRGLRHWLPQAAVPSMFVALPELPRAASGKIDYSRLPRPQALTRSALAHWPAANRCEQALVEIWQDALGITDVGVHDDFFELGGDSILAIRVVARARDRGLVLRPSLLFEFATIAELAQVVEAVSSEEEPLDGLVPLSPAQHWFFDTTRAEIDPLCQTRTLELGRHVELEELAEALGALTQRHEALRLRFRQYGDEWEQTVEHKEQGTLVRELDMSSFTDEEWTEACRGALASLCMKDGPLLQAVLGTCPDRKQLLFLAIHHLAVDHLSWLTLLEDLEAALKRTPRPASQVAPSFARWARSLPARAARPEVERAGVFWESMLTEPPPIRLGHLGPEASDAPDRIVVDLSVADTEQLTGELHKAYNTRIADWLVTAVCLAYGRWSGESPVWLTLESNGRSDGSYWATAVGWFTAIYPVTFAVDPADDIGSNLALVKDRLRDIPGDGTPYGILSHYHPAWSERLARLPEPSISFNYLGRLEGETAPGGILHTPAGGDDQQRGSVSGTSNRIEINALVAGGALRSELKWPARAVPRTAAETLARSYLEELHRLILHCSRQGGPGHTPGDFRHVDIDGTELAAILSEIQLREGAAK
jgi:amino acid adenylation domain-containing protein/non-ribosomal peptide synthase protein (TIGR01720 family)